MQRILNLADPISSRPRQQRFFLLATAAFATFLCIVVPRIGPLIAVSLTTLLSVLLLAQDIRRGDAGRQARAVLLRPEVPFLAWVFIACLWAVNPASALPKAVFLAVLVLHAIILAREAHRIDSRDVETFSRGFLIGFLIAGVYVCVEIAGSDVIARHVLTYAPDLTRGLAKHGTVRDGVLEQITGANITRVAAVFCFFLCPAALAAALHTRGAIRWLCYGAIAAFLLVIFFHPLTHSQTAQLIVLVVAAALAFAMAAPRIAQWVTGAGFAGLLFLIVPVSIAMFNADLHRNEKFFESGQARVIIWNYTAEQILKAPILGVGTNSTRYLDEERAKRGIEKPDDFIIVPATRAHPHNIYLQIWYELGVVGVLAFALLGFSLLRKVDVLPHRSFPFGIAHFAACATIIAPTYSLWQNWFQSALVLSILAFILISNPATWNADRGPPSPPDGPER